MNFVHASVDIAKAHEVSGSRPVTWPAEVQPDATMHTWSISPSGAVLLFEN